MGSGTYTDLQNENTALRLLLEEARNCSGHSWVCAFKLNIADACDCWYGKTEEMLLEPIQLVHPIETIECKGCGHPSGIHTGSITGEPRAICVKCNCSCMGFIPKEIPS